MWYVISSPISSLRSCQYQMCIVLITFSETPYQVELIGYASGDDHLHLVYEYVQNGSLGDHLHDPLLKGTAHR